MAQLCMHDTVDAHLKSNPAAARVFDSLGIDFCCGGSRTLEEACLAHGIDPAKVADLLDGVKTESDEAVRISTLGLAELADHIEQQHHELLKQELPRLDALAAKVARVHGGADPRLLQVRDRFRDLADELIAHMEKEERILFPALRALAASGSADIPCGPLAHPIAVMRGDHEAADEILETLKTLTDGFVPPSHACNSYRALLEGMQELGADLARHVRKEEDLLFPRALNLESQSRRG